MPQPLGDMLSELSSLDEQLTVLRAQRYARVEAEGDVPEGDDSAAEGVSAPEGEDNAPETEAAPDGADWESELNEAGEAGRQPGCCRGGRYPPGTCGPWSRTPSTREKPAAMPDFFVPESNKYKRRLRSIRAEAPFLFVTLRVPRLWPGKGHGHLCAAAHLAVQLNFGMVVFRAMLHNRQAQTRAARLLERLPSTR